MIRAFLCAALLAIGNLPLAQANLEQLPANARLFSADEWQRMCAAFDRDDLVSLCTAKVHRGVAKGRSLGTFEPVQPEDRKVLQTRSGVFLQRQLNELVVQVREDNSLKTRLLLKDDVQCQVYAAAPDLVGRPRRDVSYHRLIEAWLKEYTDSPFSSPDIRLTAVDQKSALQFEAETGTRTILGTYVFDEKANAGIFTTCDHHTASTAARKNAGLFLKSVIGSARRFS